MPYDAPPDLRAMSLADIARAASERKLPPIERWNPAASADSEMRIRADGRWLHQGQPIGRPAMVRAFAALLTRDGDGRHWLLTPECRLAIAVDDAAFIAVDLDVRADRSGYALAFRLNTDEVVLAGAEHPLRAAGDADRPAIYLGVRHGCEARLDRSTWLQLAEHALAIGDGTQVSSQGAVFSLLPA